VKKRNQSNYRSKIIKPLNIFNKLDVGASNPKLIWLCTKHVGRKQQPKIPRVKSSFYLGALVAKQALKAWYGDISERQFSNLFHNEANRNVSEFLALLESRLDIVLYRSGFLSTIFNARQFINHNGVYINGVLARSPGQRLLSNDLIEFPSAYKQDIYKNLGAFTESIQNTKGPGSTNLKGSHSKKLGDFFMLRHLAVDLKSLRIVYLEAPKESDIPLPLMVSANPNSKLYYQNRDMVTKGRRGYDSYQFFKQRDLEKALTKIDTQKLRFFYR
jgi:small subunit ribosomal protein S4